MTTTPAIDPSVQNSKVEAAMARLAMQNDDDSDDDYNFPAPTGQSKYSLDEIKSNPLFMTQEEVDKMIAAGDNPALQAVQDMIYNDRTPREIAEDLKEKGNEQMKRNTKNSCKTAVERYTEALEQRCGDAALETVILSNRAQANLLLGNYGKALEDCRAALKLTPGHAKSAYRAARAAFALEKWEDCLSLCDLAADQPELAELARQSREKLRVKREAQDKRDAEKKKRDAENHRLLAAIQAHGVRLTKTLYDVKGQYATEVTLDDQGRLHWPVMVLYPEHTQSDFIGDFVETSTFVEELLAVFPPGEPCPPWDLEQKYRLADLRVFHERHFPPSERGMIRKNKAKFASVAPTDTLQSVLARPDAFVPGIPIFYAFVQKSQALKDWLEEES